MSTLPWWPVVAVDIAGWFLALVVGLSCAVVAWRLKARHPEDVFVAYLSAFTLVILVFVASRSVGHILKQALVLSGHEAAWTSLAPFSGAINTATFVAAFVISAFFGVMVRLNQRVRRSTADAASARARADAVQADMHRLQTVFEGVDAYVCVCGLDGRVRYFNRNMGELVPDIRVGGPCEGLLAPPSAAVRRPRGDGGGPADGNRRFEIHVTEGKRVLSVSTIPIEWTDHEPARLVAAFDVTELRRTQEQLRHSQKLEAIGTLAGGIAHDFNNILAAVIGYSDLAQLETEEGTPLHESLSRIRKAADRAKDLVKRILTFAREGEQELRPLQVRPVVDEALKLLRVTLPATIELRTSLSSEAVVLADPTRLHQVLVNLCTNAALAIGSGGGSIEVELDDVNLDEAFVSAHPELTPGPHLRLRVTDDGCGMTPEVRERIFDPFFTTRPSGEGSGLGLSVVHGIVRACKGAITVYSEPGAGASFNVFLPIAEQEAAAELAAPETPHGEGERVLFVDDETDNIELARAMLGRLGYRVTATSSSEGALETFAASPGAFDVVVTDLTMPRLPGDALADAIRAIRPDVPILLTTGYSAHRAQGWRSRGGQVLPKPFSLQEVALALRSCLTQNRRAL